MTSDVRPPPLHLTLILILSQLPADAFVVVVVVTETEVAVALLTIIFTLFHLTYLLKYTLCPHSRFSHSEVANYNAL